MLIHASRVRQIKLTVLRQIILKVTQGEISTDQKRRFGFASLHFQQLADAENVITLECSPKPKHSSADSKPPATTFVAITTQSTRGPVIVTATTPSSETFTAQDPNGDEAAALNQLARRLGLDSDPN